MSNLASGQMFGGYEVVSVAGTGGMGVVYRAVQSSLRRTVALKVIREEIARMPEYRERFLHEARRAAAVDHPHVVSVYDVGEHDGNLFLAMQWIEGRDLGSLITEFGPRSPERAVATITQVASALDAVHRVAGLIHRDVKPANVLVRDVDGKDHAYLTDFGVARAPGPSGGLTEAGWVVGTTGYMAPEQIMGQDPSARSDLYALGCVLFETLTGKPPFAGENEMAVRWAHAQSPRPKPSEALPELGAHYDAFVARALAIDPEQRFASGREFAAALVAAQDQRLTGATVAQPHAPTALGPPSPMPPPQTPVPGMYPAYGYATPPPPYEQPSRSGSPVALVLLALVALAGIAVGALAATGVFSHPSASTQTITSTGASTPANAGKAAGAKTGSGAAGASGGTMSCGGDLSVGPNTSCGFAQNVENAYQQSSGGDTDVTAYSPATGQTYTMHCTGGSPHVCTGGDNASVYFTSSPSSSSAPNVPGGTSCGGGLVAGPNTSCSFAQNVQQAYAGSGGGNTKVTASSPVTGQTYTMSCTGGSPHTCTGGNDASVYFP